MTKPVSMPNEAKARKGLPVFSGVVEYFPDALLAIAEVSKAGNDQHNPGQPLHWSRGKSDDHPDTALRHLMEHGTKDIDGKRHTAKAAWRVLAMLQLEIEAERAPVATTSSEHEGFWTYNTGERPGLPPATVVRYVQRGGDTWRGTVGFLEWALRGGTEDIIKWRIAE